MTHQVGTYQVGMVRGIAEIGEETWARLAAGRSFYLSYPWLRWAETAAGVDTVYLAAYSRDARVVGAVPCYLWDGGTVPSMNAAYDVVAELLTPNGVALSPPERRRWLPALLVGSRAGYHGGVLVDPALAPPERERVLIRLFRAVTEHAAGSGAGSVAMLYVPETHAAECAAAWRVALDGTPGPYAAPLSAEATVRPVTREPFATPTLSARSRREWYREERRFTEAAEAIGSAPLSACVAEIGPLLGHTQRKYGASDSDEAMTRYLAGQVPFLDSHSHVLLEYDGGAVVGFALTYSWGDALAVRAAGFSDRCAPFAYFNLAVYGPVRLAMDRGLGSVELGAGSYRGKFLRGADLSPTWSLVVPPAGAPPEWLTALTGPGGDYLAARAVDGALGIRPDSTLTDPPRIR
ncbi:MULTISPECIES: hypothetical protein [Protofrankia]|uniref:BioF2-like acetyltransferase domain-containing protein n=1 Tax=Candidatus Protofrankia datiscae TaxID=2716812 RepID=F8B4A2_9ACTN|nr:MULTISPECIES: hypothetical protein [Protofrankia]AEH09298.1 hypothetical protein FsymDg_1855 [Candidatus Protofrankia datiscae]